jgi:hypothetical protein
MALIPERATNGPSLDGDRALYSDHIDRDFGKRLLLQREILAASVPRAAAIGEKQTIVRIVAAAQAHAPPGMIADHVDLPTAEGASAVVQVGKPGQEQRKVAIYVDPVSLTILGSSDVVEPGPILAFLIGVHAFLMMPPHFGLPFVGWMAIMMTFMGFSVNTVVATQTTVAEIAVDQPRRTWFAVSLGYAPRPRHLGNYCFFSV